MICHLLLILLSVSLLMIVSFIAPSAPGKLRISYKEIWTLLNGGVIFGAWNSIPVNAILCPVSIARSRSPFTYLYALCGQVLSSVPEARYLGIMVTDELSLSSHVQSIYSKANSTLGFLRHNLRLKESCLYLTCSLHIGICRIGMGLSPGQGHQQVRKL